MERHVDPATHEDIVGHSVFCGFLSTKEVEALVRKTWCLGLERKSTDLRNRIVVEMDHG